MLAYAKRLCHYRAAPVSKLLTIAAQRSESLFWLSNPKAEKYNFKEYTQLSILFYYPENLLGSGSFKPVTLVTLDVDMIYWVLLRS